MTQCDNPPAIDGQLPVGVGTSQEILVTPYVPSHDEICVSCGSLLWISDSQTIPVIAYVCYDCFSQQVVDHMRLELSLLISKERQEGLTRAESLKAKELATSIRGYEAQH